MDHRSRTTRRTALFADTSVDDSPEHPTLLISPLPSLSSVQLFPSHSRLFSARTREFSDSYSLDVSFSHSPRMFRLRQSIIAGSLRRRFYRYRQGRPFRSRGRRDLSALTIAHSIVSTIGELNGETESLTSRAPFG